MSYLSRATLAHLLCSSQTKVSLLLPSVMGRAWTASPTCPALCRLSTLAPCPFSSLLVALRYLAFLSECSLLPQLSLLADFAYSGPCAWSALSLNSAYLDLNVIVSENLPDSLI